MCGISGGGWTTTITAAIDTRIDYSFPVAGSFPMYVRFNYSKKSYGDFEQDYPDLYRKVNYLDLYLLGATGEGRKQVQVLNLKDPCCFDGLYSQHYEPFVKEAVKNIGTGFFNVVIDNENSEHSISEFSLEKIYAEIN
jgi:PhoPQ-activated pathogenicity-related protein